MKALILHGRACLQLEDVKQAREDVTRALQLDHKNLGARTLLGQIEEYENQMELPERKELDMVIGIPLRKADQSSDDGASD